MLKGALKEALKGTLKGAFKGATRASLKGMQLASHAFILLIEACDTCPFER